MLGPQPRNESVSKTGTEAKVELNKRVYASVLILAFLHVFVLFMYILWNKYVKTK